MRALLAALLLFAGAARAGDVFDRTWNDGKGELDGYDLIQPRYGELRHGRAVLIYVTEPFSRSRRVKVEKPDANDPDQLPVLKLNLVKRFQTGIYDYGLTTSVFTDPARGFAPLKVAFSSQEWCGLVYEEMRFDPGRVSLDRRSYFEGETGSGSVPVGDDAVSEDALFVQLRQLDRERLDPAGGARQLVPGATFRRLLHQPFALSPTTIAWAPQESSVTVPAGTFAAREASYTRADGVSCAFQVEAAYPHRLVAWKCGDGEEARLTGSTRLPYWQTHGEGDEKLLQQLGLTPAHLAP
jgi:hypothetical protein